MIIVADTTALYAAFDAAQAEHDAARALLETERFVVSPLVLAELDHLIHRDLGFPAVLAVLQALNARIADGQYRLAELRQADLVTAHEIRVKYEALALDLADAVGVVLADKYRTDRIFTLDYRDFRSITPLTGGFRSFHLLPADGSTD